MLYGEWQRTEFMLPLIGLCVFGNPLLGFLFDNGAAELYD